MIITNNEEALRVQCSNVTEEEVGGLLDLLHSELNEANRLGKGGVGLAAPQIGIPKNIAIVKIGNVEINLVNAKIEKGFDPAKFYQEGCLSFPGRVEDTIRYQEVYVTNNLIYPNSFVATGLIAVICQHEIGHLNNELFFDKAAPKNIITTNTQQKIKIGPNDICYCGSNKKYKKCCGKK